jgi:hypothetical protein
MPELPKRPGPYIVILLLVILGVLVAWMFSALQSPIIQQVEAQKKGGPKRQPQPSAVLPAETSSMPAASQALDPHLASMAARLNSTDHEPREDLEILEELLSIYRRALGGNPSGDNSDVVAALVGNTPQGAFFPRQSPALRDGQLLDRWGTPYWFHPNSGHSMEIRSAGADKQLFTPDDIILNPSPAGLGATPLTAPEMPQ